MHARLFAKAVVALLFFLTELAHADDRGPLKWREEWPRFRPAEVALTLGLTLNVAQALFLYPPPQANWTGGILFDDAIRDGLRLDGREARKTAAEVSDAIYYVLATYPLIVDTAAVTWAAHGAGDVAFQMLLINLEAYALTGAIALTFEKLGRVRPMGQDCAKNPGYDPTCQTGNNLNASFLSGHTTIAFAGAGLICAHHGHLPLYGGGIADKLACATGLLAASTAGVLRVMSDNHYASDVLLGTAVGLFGGYVMPSLLHYGFGSERSRPKSLLPALRVRTGELTVSCAFAPLVAPTQLGITAAFAFSWSAGHPRITNASP